MLIMYVGRQVETLKAFDGDRSKLGNAEKFLELLIALPAYKIRIEGMLLKAEFQVRCHTFGDEVYVSNVATGTHCLHMSP